jgi:DNA polymerase-1
MISIHAEIKKRKLISKMVLQVHDELVFDASLNEIEELSKLVKELMEKAMPLKIPVLAEVGIGANWLESH